MGIAVRYCLPCTFLHGQWYVVKCMPTSPAFSTVFEDLTQTIKIYSRNLSYVVGEV